MSSLKELSQERLEIDTLLIESNGEISASVNSWLELVNKQLAQKVDSYDYIIKALTAEAEFLDMRAAELWVVAKAKMKFVQDLKDRIKITMMDMQTNELQGETKSFKLTRSGKKLLLEESIIPPEFNTTVITHVPDKERIKTCLATGQDIPGARFEEIIQLRTYTKTK